MVTGYNRQSPGHSVPGLPDPPRVRARGVYDAYERLVSRYLEPTLRKDEFVAARGAKGIADLSDHLIVSVTSFRPTAEQHRSYPSHPSHTQIPNRHPINTRDQPPSPPIHTSTQVTPYDEGACYVHPALATAVFLTHW